jgi:exopolysaccharide biosynthesis predicted pyruvyltransferase EpsI
MGGVPHVLRDNSTGKLSGFYEAWTHEAQLAELADDDHAALERALRLAAEPASPLVAPLGAAP